MVNRVNGRQADVSRASILGTVLPYLGYGLSIINIDPHMGQGHLDGAIDDAVVAANSDFFRVRAAMFEEYSARRSPKVSSTVNLATIAGFEGRMCLRMEHRDLHFWCDPPPDTSNVDNQVWSPQQLLNLSTHHHFLQSIAVRALGSSTAFQALTLLSLTHSVHSHPHSFFKHPLF